MNSKGAKIDEILKELECVYGSGKDIKQIKLSLLRVVMKAMPSLKLVNMTNGDYGYNQAIEEMKKNLEEAFK
mgnify:CR=1 FL=1